MTDTEKRIEEHVFENFDTMIDEYIEHIKQSVSNSEPEKLGILDISHINRAKQAVREKLCNDVKAYAKRCVEKCEVSDDAEDLLEEEISPMIHKMFLTFFTEIMTGQ